jgi:hypothetical protein
MAERFTCPEEVTDLIVPLANERTGNVIGSGFVIDGGLTTTLCTQGSAS